MVDFQREIFSLNEGPKLLLDDSDDQSGLHIKIEARA